MELYSHLGATGAEILRNVWSRSRAHPPRFLASAHDRKPCLGHALAVPRLPLLRPRWLLIAAPIMLQHLLSLRPVEWSIDLHYAAPLIPLFWIAAVEGARRFLKPHALAVGILIACAVGQVWIGLARSFPKGAELRAQFAERSWKAQMLAPIAADHSLAVTASQPFLSHLATRRELHSLHHILKGLKTLSREELPPPLPGDAVIIDFADATTFSPEAGYYHPPMRLANGHAVPASDQLLATFLAPARWKRSAENALTVLRRAALTGSGEAANASSPAGETLVPGLLLRSAGMTEGAPGEPASFTLRWQMTDERRTMPWLMLVLSDGVQLRSIPAGMCAVGAGIGEGEATWRVRLPADFPPSNYDCFALFYDHTHAAWSRRMPPGDATFTVRTVPLGHHLLAPTQ